LSACCILDGNFAINIELPQLSVVGGDRLVFCVAAASIIAKVERDRAMDRYDALYPGWGFARHKGYPTKEHLSLLKKQKPCPIHRKTFAPVTESLAR
jgi:ribonuclease HII